jgi:long-subunit fatty acid transport protein
MKHRVLVAAAAAFVTPTVMVSDYKLNEQGARGADETHLTSIKFQPAVAYCLNDQVFIGFGLDITYMKGLLSKQVDLVPFNERLKLLNNAKNPVDALGFAELTDDPWAGSVPDQGSEIPITTPQSLTLSYAQQLTNKLQLVAAATWTQWSFFENLDVKSTESELGQIEALGGLGNGYIGHIEENWQDTVALAIAANYPLNDDWLLRTGYAIDQSPVSNSYRTARDPDNNRQWLSSGVNYRINQDVDVDFVFSYLFFEDTEVNEYDRNLDGSVKEGSSNLQVTYSMDAIAYLLQVNYKL